MTKYPTTPARRTRAPRRPRHTLTAAVLLTTCSLPTRAAASLTSWIGPSGNWSTPSGWSLGTAPVSGDAVGLKQSDALDRTVTLDVSTPSLAGLTIDSAGAGLISLAQSANTLTTNGENVGYFGAAKHTISGGAETISLSLYLGYSAGSAGTFSLTGTGSLNVAGTEFVGLNGNGTLVQTGGTNTVGQIDIAASAGSSGTYSLSGGTASAPHIYVGGNSGGATGNGYGGAGVLNISGTASLSSSGALQIWNTPGSALNLAGGALTVGNLNFTTNPSHFNWTAGSLTITGPSFNVSTLGASYTLTPARTFTVTNQLYVPSGSTLSFTGGTLSVGSLDTAATPADFHWTAGTLSFTSTPPAISSSGPLGPSVKLSPGMALRATALPTISSASTLDIAGGSLVVAYTGSSPAGSLRSLLLAGRITSSSANADPQHPLAIGYSDAASTLTAFLTPLADANLDGKLNADDYTLLDRAFARHTVDAHWTDGDFNYDGIINNQDYLLIDTAYLQQQGGTPSPALLSQRESQFGDAYVSQLLTSVPEPSSLFAACGLAVPLLSRRRTNS